MPVTFEDFIEHVIDDLGRDTTDIRARIPNWTNRSIRKAYREMNLWLAFKTVERDLEEGKRSYPTPELIDDSQLFYYMNTDRTGWTPVDVKSHREAILRFGPEDTGSPEIIVIGKSAIQVYPLPDTTYPLRARLHAYEEDLDATDAAGQESDLINENEDLVLYWVLERGFNHLEEFDTAREYGAKAAVEKRELIAKNTRKLMGGGFTLTPSSNAQGLITR